MHYLRKLGMYVSLFILWAAHVVRWNLAYLTGKKEWARGVRVILVNDRSVLLVSHWYAPWTWTLPGGNMEPGETIEQTGMRETREEVGLEIKSIAGVIGTYRGPLGKGDSISVVYTGDFEGSMSLTPTLEIMARSWFDIDNLPPEISPANRRRIEAYRAGVREEVGKW
ncbi:MAG: Nudix hydrolase [Parcubacteria group bacterium GW2011_GWA2_51_10]|nr:MAG: Nudix hydrolase [Parcubacteria group bacterium GW2011_GWA2_51_10]